MPTALNKGSEINSANNKTQTNKMDSTAQLGCLLKFASTCRIKNKFYLIFRSK